MHIVRRSPLNARHPAWRRKSAPPDDRHCAADRGGGGLHRQPSYDEHRSASAGRGPRPSQRWLALPEQCTARRRMPWPQELLHALQSSVEWRWARCTARACGRGARALCVGGRGARGERAEHAQGARTMRQRRIQRAPVGHPNGARSARRLRADARAAHALAAVRARARLVCGRRADATRALARARHARADGARACSMCGRLARACMARKISRSPPDASWRPCSPEERGRETLLNSMQPAKRAANHGWRSMPTGARVCNFCVLYDPLAVRVGCARLLLLRHHPHELEALGYLRVRAEDVAPDSKSATVVAREAREPTDRTI